MNSIKKNFLFNASYQLLNILLPLVTAPYIARTLGAVGLGEYTYTFTLASYFQMFAILGFAFHGNRQIAKNRDDRQKRSQAFFEIFTFQVLISSFVAFVYVLYVVLLADPVHRKLLLVQIFYVLSAMLDVSWLYFGMENFKATTIRNFAVKLLTLAGIFTFVKTPDDVHLYAVIMAGGTLISQLILWCGVPKIVDVKKEYCRLKLEHLVRSFILFVPMIAVSVYSMMDKLMLGGLAGMEQLAFYENAHKIISAPICLITAFEAVMLPRMINLASKGERESADKLIEESFSLVGMVAAPMTVGMVVIANRLTLLLFGEDFSASGGIMTILAVTIPLVSWAGVIRKEILIPGNQDKTYIISVFVGAGVNLVLNAVLIPVIGAVGAAWGTVMAEVSVCVYQSAKTWKSHPYKKYLRDNFLFVVAALIMGLCVCTLDRLLPANALCLVGIIIVGIAVYFVLFVAVLKIQKKSIKDSLLWK